MALIKIVVVSNAIAVKIVMNRLKVVARRGVMMAERGARIIVIIRRPVTSISRAVFAGITMRTGCTLSARVEPTIGDSGSSSFKKFAKKV